MALAGGAGGGLGAGLGARSAAVIAGRSGGNGDLGGLARKGLFQGDVHVVAQIGTPVVAAPALPAAAHELAEQIVKHVREGGAEVAVKAGTAAAILKCRMAKPVVGLALFIVREDVVSFRDFLELGLRSRIALIAVRMILHGQLAVGLFQIALAGLPVNAEDVVKILLSHGPGPPRLPNAHTKTSERGPARKTVRAAFVGSRTRLTSQHLA